MKVGVLQFFSWPGRRVPLETVYARALARIDIMDGTGYDAVWLAEHHFTTYSVCPSVHLMAMHVADRTRHLRIGTAVSLAAFYHPLRLAEEVALLDVLTGGRVNWGAGRGFDRTEFATFGVDPEQSAARFREAVDVVFAAWTNERLTFHGRFFDFDDVEVLPKPAQKPHPPSWVAASSPDAIAWAASKGYDILMDPHSSHADIATKQQLYFDGLASAGFSVHHREIPVARLVAVAPTRAEAEAVARQGAEWTVGAYADPKSHHHVSPDPNAHLPLADPVERYVKEVIIWGTPAEVVDQVTELHETSGLGYLMCAPLSHGTFELFTGEVLPHIGGL